jgi:hypothetical protein
LNIADHTVEFDAAGRLVPWTSWTNALQLQMDFYQQCPLHHGYPRFVCETFLDGNWIPSSQRSDIIPATQNGMGIISYLGFHELRGTRESVFQDTARLMGDYLIKETLTPNRGIYPAFTRSTGKREQFPLAADCGSQADHSYEIEPDKGGIAGYALVRLFESTGERLYLDQGLHQARVLAAQLNAGDAMRSPWPFRVDYRDGRGRGPVSGNMSYILRLFDVLTAQGFDEFLGPRAMLWTWIKNFQLPSASGDGALFAQFFEDHDTPTNRTSWAPLNLARYLLEKRELLDPDWRANCGSLLEFVRANFTHRELGVAVCHEQDEDRQAWNGVNSTYGAVLAMYAKATDSAQLADDAREALNFTLYSTDSAGRPRDLFASAEAGGWQEDAHTDVIHNYVDALRAFPQWGE